MVIEAADPADRDVIADLVMANRILALKGVIDGFGHVSCRSTARTDRFLLSRSRAPALIRAPDIHVFDLDGECRSDSAIQPYLERFIHSEIYRRRPQVQAIVHAHTPSVLPFAVVPAFPLRAIMHMGAFIGEGLPIFEIRSVDKESDMLIRSAGLGVALAEQLGSASAVLMRGHGVTVVGDSVRQVVFRSVYLEMNARIQAAAHGLGDPVYLNAAEAAAADATNDRVVDRPWALWEREVLLAEQAEAVSAPNSATIRAM